MISMDEEIVLEKARKAILRKIETEIGSCEKQANNTRFKAITDGICALGVLDQIMRTASKRCGIGVCANFAVYIDGDDENKGTGLRGVEKVNLPDLGTKELGTVFDVSTTASVEFDCLENAHAVQKKQGVWRMEVREAIKSLEKTGEYDIHLYKHIMDVQFVGLTQVPLEITGRAAVTATFLVRGYTAYVNDKKLWEITDRKPEQRVRAAGGTIRKEGGEGHEH